MIARGFVLTEVQHESMLLMSEVRLPLAYQRAS